MDEVKTDVAQVTEPEEVLHVEEGYKLIPIMNELNEQVGVFRFNPTDINIINRYNEMMPKFRTAVAPLSKAGVDEHGQGTDEESVKVLNEAEEKVIEFLDYVTQGDSKTAFFSRTHMFTPVNGNFYCENVINAIGQYISKKFEKELRATDEKVSKYTHGYRTGKHRKGDR